MRVKVDVYEIMNTFYYLNFFLEIKTYSKGGVDFLGRGCAISEILREYWVNVDQI